MIADLKPYAEYKDSGSRWLKKIPSHWEIRSLRTLIRPLKLRNRPDLPLLSVAREKGVFVRSLTDSNENHNVIPEDLASYKVASAGSLVINKMKAWQGSMGIAPCDGIVSPAYFVFDFAIDDPAFGHRLLRSKPYVAHFAQASDGVRVGQWDLTVSGMRKIPVLVPQPAEQAAIVKFLDWANNRLERTIRAKRRVIALLTEQKQVIVQEAVIHGLDAGGQLKSSGISWLGQIPQHWQIVPARHLFRAVTRKDILGSEPKMSVTQKHGLIATTDMLENATQAASFERFQLCHPGDLVLNKYKAHLGVFWAAECRGLITPNYTVFRPSPGVSSKFFEYVFHTGAYRDAISMIVYGVIDGMCPLYTQDFNKIPCVLPPYDEQVNIVAALADKTARENEAIHRLEREIQLLQEYRACLAADVVTGKVDVREAAARLPDNAESAIGDGPADELDAAEITDEEAET